jgi:V/A-type H+/Na+-transporting ATPase subunit D
MSRLTFSKASLQKQSANLKRYHQYLPSLDLKRQQLIAERTKAQTKLAELDKKLQDCLEFVNLNLPMLSSSIPDLSGLVKVSALEISTENIVGINLPRLQNVQIQVKHYSTYCRPHWVDPVVVQLQKTLELKLQHHIFLQRVTILEKAVKKVSQRVNLLDKVLIPKSLQNIRKIRIFLSDAERAGVVRAKLTKQKQAE